jgi:hypothetical protein
VSEDGKAGESARDERVGVDADEREVFQRCKKGAVIRGAVDFAGDSDGFSYFHNFFLLKNVCFP